MPHLTERPIIAAAILTALAAILLLAGAHPAQADTPTPTSNKSGNNDDYGVDVPTPPETPPKPLTIGQIKAVIVSEGP